MGVAIADREGASLHLVTVVPPVSTLPPPPEGLGVDFTVEEALRDGFRQYLDEQAQQIRQSHPLVSVACAVLDGRVAHALADYARSEAIDLVVLTTHGWGGFKRLWLGSVAQALVHRLQCPALLLRPSSGAPTMGWRRVLVALDNDQDASLLLEPAMALGLRADGAQYTLLQVVELQSPLIFKLAGIPAKTGAAWVREIADEARTRLEQVAQGLRARGITADVRVVAQRGTANQILAQAKRPGCDLIVLGTRVSGLERAAFGSVADKVIRGATQMVLVVPLGTAASRPAPTARQGAASAAAH